MGFKSKIEDLEKIDCPKKLLKELDVFKQMIKDSDTSIKEYAHEIKVLSEKVIALFKNF